MILNTLRRPESKLAHRGRKAGRASVFLLCSMILHAATVFFLVRQKPHWPSGKNSSALKIWLTKPRDIDKKAVVENEDVIVTVRPKNARFLAAQNHSAKKETRRPLSNGRTAGIRDSAQNNNAEPQAGSGLINGGLAAKARGKKAMADARSKSAKPPIDRKDPYGFRPSVDSKQSYNQLLLGTDEGDRTDLNTWQWRHAPFFNRIKARVSATWSPRAQIARYDPKGILLGQRDRVTVMTVIIDREGLLKDIHVRDSSGVAYLDEEAENAFKRAAPFLHPPPELFNTSVEFSFTFAFYVQVGRKFSFDFEWDDR